MERLIVVSGDSHATPQPELWPEYLETKYHYLLPEIREDNERYKQLLGMFADFSPETLEVMDGQGAWQSGGYLGAWDPERRLAEMDREGVAAELVYGGDPRAILPLSPLYHRYPRTWSPPGRGPTTAGRPTSSARQWTASSSWGTRRLPRTWRGCWRSWRGSPITASPGPTCPASAPGRTSRPLYDAYFDPFWSACEDLGLPIVIHAGYGTEQCEFMDKIEALRVKMEAEGRDDLLSEIINNAEGFFSLDLRPRRAMWQLMLGGVFDRHPKLRLVMTEVRADWLPATLGHLDAAYEGARAELPARRRPSEYWHEHCLTSLSFVHQLRGGHAPRDRAGDDHLRP